MLGIGFNQENQFYTFDMFDINTDLTFFKIKTTLDMSGFDTYEPYISTYIDNNFEYRHECNDQLVTTGDFMAYEMIQTTIKQMLQKCIQRTLVKANNTNEIRNNNDGGKL